MARYDFTDIDTATLAPVNANGEAFYELGIAYASRGFIDDAIAEFRHALELEPDSAQTEWHLGAALASKGALTEAADVLSRSVQRDPRNVDAKHDLETVLALQRQRQRFP